MKELNILKVKINKVAKNKLLEILFDAICKKEKTRLYTVNNEFIVEAQSNQKYLKALNNSTISIADSVGVVWAAKKLLGEEVERIPGADLFFDLLKEGNRNHLKIFLLGGSSGVGKNTKLYINKYFEHVEVDFVDGIKIMENTNNESLIEKINSFSPDILFVALGAPKQELWIDNNFNKLNARLFVGIGGTLDFVSGKIKRAPAFLRNIGLEWLFRLMQQPSRAKRIFKAVVTFPLLVLTGSKES